MSLKERVIMFDEEDEADAEYAKEVYWESRGL
jgi:hypothetical protein